MDSIRDCFCFHCQAGHFDLVYRTAFMHVRCALLLSETQSTLIIGNQDNCINISDILSSVGSFLSPFFFFFFHQELDLCVSIAWLPLLTFLSLLTVIGVSLQADAEIGLGAFLIVWFVVYPRRRKRAPSV